MAAHNLNVFKLTTNLADDLKGLYISYSLDFNWVSFELDLGSFYDLIEVIYNAF